MPVTHKQAPEYTDDEIATMLFQYIFQTTKTPKDYSLQDTSGSVDESQILPRLKLLAYEMAIDGEDMHILLNEQQQGKHHK